MLRDLARTLRKNMTDAETFVWKRIRQRQIGGYKFRRQQELGPYIVDFVCLESRLIFELDGGQHAEQVEADAERFLKIRRQALRIPVFEQHGQKMIAGVRLLQIDAGAVFRQRGPDPVQLVAGWGGCILRMLRLRFGGCKLHQCRDRLVLHSGKHEGDRRADQHDRTEQQDDEGTADMFLGIVKDMEKQAWFFRSYLEEGQGQSRTNPAPRPVYYGGRKPNIGSQQ